MTSLALGLVFAAAVLHATWNYWAKRAGGGLPFVYVVSLIIAASYLPVVVGYCWWQPPDLRWSDLGVVLVSGVLKTGYSLYLQRGYRNGDFSLIYPLARGTGPLLSMLAAIVLLGERPSAVALLGGLAIVGSIFWLTGGLALFSRSKPVVANETASTIEARRAVGLAVRYGLISGVFIAAYTVWDQRGVSHWRVPPLLYDAGTAYTQLCLLTPFALRRWGDVAREWREHRKNACIVAFVSPVSYVLVLTAMSFTPVSYVAPAREISIVIGAFFGAKLLKESGGRRRLWAAAVMALGIIALAVG
jgi:drug/metabolite transporter (DMT)-like permease